MEQVYVPPFHRAAQYVLYLRVSMLHLLMNFTQYHDVTTINVPVLRKSVLRKSDITARPVAILGHTRKLATSRL